MMVVSFPPGQRPDGPWSFLRKRVARIYPFYWLTTAAMLFGWGVGLFDTLLPPALETDWIIRSFLLAPSEVLVVGVAWTLVHEMNFYLLFALSLCFGNRLVSLFGVTALLLLQLMAAPYLSDPATALFLSRPIALELAFGLALGYIYLNGVLKAPAPLLLSLAAFAALHVAPLFIPHESTGGLDADDRVWAWGLPSVILVAACLHWRVGKGASSRAWLLMGDASYAIYLLHPVVMASYAKALDVSDLLLHAPQPPLIAIATVASAAVGVAAHVFLERPLTQVARRLLLPARSKPVTIVERPTSA